MFQKTTPQTLSVTTSIPSAREAEALAEEVSHPWARLRWLAAVAPVLMIFVIGVPAMVVDLLLPVTETSPAGRAVTSIVLQSVVVAATMIAAVAGLARLSGMRLRDIGWRWTSTSPRALALGAALTTPMVFGLGVVLSQAGVLRANTTPSLPMWGVLVAGLVQAWLLQGMPEELLFRGYQMAAWRVRPMAAVVLSALVFAVPHLASRGGQQSATERVLYLAIPIGMGMLAGGLMLLTRSLWSAVGVHGGWHTGVLVAQIAGLGTGPAFWVACGAVATTIGVGAMVMAQRRGLPQTWTGPTR